MKHWRVRCNHSSHLGKWHECFLSDDTHKYTHATSLPRVTTTVLSTIYNESSYLSSLREIDYRSLFFRWRIKFHVCKSRAGLISQRSRCCTGRHAANNLLFFARISVFATHRQTLRTPSPTPSRSHASLPIGLIPGKANFQRRNTRKWTLCHRLSEWSLFRFHGVNYAIMKACKVSYWNVLNFELRQVPRRLNNIK